MCVADRQAKFIGWEDMIQKSKQVDLSARKLH